MVPRAREALVGAAIALGCAWALAGCGSGHESGDPPSSVKRVLDVSYGSAGQVVLPDDVSTIAVAPDGSVFVGSVRAIEKLDASGRSVWMTYAAPGYWLASDASANVYTAVFTGVYKFNEQGPDLSYGASGVASVFALTRDNNRFVSLVPLRDGTLYVMGHRVRYDDTGDAAIWIVKLAPDGSAMTSFGNGGRLDFQPVKSTWPGDIAVDNDGNLYVSFANATQNVTMGVAKFDRDGKSVASFGNAGIWSGSRTRCHAWKPAVDSSGFVWVAGECTDASGAFSEALVKLDANGRPVPEFGNAGYLDGFLGPVANKSAESIALRIVIAPEGSMYLNGYVVVAGCAQRWLVALDSQGKRIPSFGTDGTMLGVWSVALDAANRLYVASVAPNCPAADQKFTAVLSRYL